ncbi:MAG: isopentenyl-diphosphate Delta-isomerase [Rhizobiaceae bacterium]
MSATAPADPLIPAIAGDGTLYPIGKMEAHLLGRKHLAISAFVFCGDRLLLQRRAAAKYHSPGQWANTCCTHPHWGEDIADGAHRRLKEELGLALPLHHRAVVEYRAEVGQGLVEHEVVHVFEGHLARPVATAYHDPAEVAETRWATIASLMAEAKANPTTFTPWLRIYLQRWNELELRLAA